jgi:hypothetical protein
MKRALILLFASVLAVAVASAQQLPAAQSGASPQVAVPSSPEFLKAADEVLQQMSELLSLPVREPLKKSLRSRAEIRAYLVREMEEDKEPAKRYADIRTLEKFGLIPQGFPLDSFMLDLLTDQVAGLYDPKAREFYIADWIPVGEQRPVMAHELTHALDDQYFHIDSWVKAARPNDDAELARDAAVEGSALAAMLDYVLRDEKIGVRDLPDISLLISGQALDQMEKDPMLQKAPPFIRDELLFPYMDGSVFTQQFLKAKSGWPDFRKVFENPPVSTQQILHPDLYLAGTKPVAVELPDLQPLASGWKKLDENVLGEFGLREVLKQFIGDERAAKVSPTWAGDRYAILENDKKQALLVYRLRLSTPEDAARFLGQYSEALELKYKTRTELFRRPNFFQFQTDQGGVFLRCLGSECLTVEGAGREVFDKVNRAIGWPAAPAPANIAAEVSYADSLATRSRGGEVRSKWRPTARALKSSSLRSAADDHHGQIVSARRSRTECLQLLKAARR